MWMHGCCWGREKCWQSNLGGGVREGLRRGLRVEGGGIKGKGGDIRVDGSGLKMG